LTASSICEGERQHDVGKKSVPPCCQPSDERDTDEAAHKIPYLFEEVLGPQVPVFFKIPHRGTFILFFNSLYLTFLPIPLKRPAAIS